jgi:hypothetical protein
MSEGTGSQTQPLNEDAKKEDLKKKMEKKKTCLEGKPNRKFDSGAQEYVRSVSEIE